MKSIINISLFILGFSLLSMNVSTAQILLDGQDCEKSAQWLRTNCYLCSGTENSSPCEIQSFGYLGQVDSHFYYYALYSTIEPLEEWEKPIHRAGAFNNHIVVIFEGRVDSLNLRPIWQEGSQHDFVGFKTPELFKTQFGYILHIFESSGNGGWDAGHNFHRDEGKWVDLYTPDWNVTLQSSLPKGYFLCRGSEIDFRTMTIKLNVYAPNDPCCCPKGGTVLAHLSIRGSAFIPDHIEYSAQSNDSK